MDGELLVTFLLVLALATAVLLLFHRLRLPPLLGFLLTGILVGPHGLGLVHTLATVEVVAEAGVVLLLFTIGLEFSFQRLRRIQRTLLTVGTTQVVVTVLAVLAVARASGQPLARSVFLGLLVALSSTVVVLRLLQEKYELDTQHGGIALAVLIFQDLAVVPMLLVTPLLGGRGDGAGAAGELLLLLGKAAAIIALVVVAARFVVPRLFYLIARTRSSELFSLSILVTCFAVAGLTSWLGLSLALGAFLAGLTLSDSEYGHQAFASMVPFRDVFASFFFISIGMLLDPGFVLRHPLAVLTACAVVLGIKVLVAGGAVQLFGHSLRNAVLVGFSLAQIGEFSFILAQEGLAHGLLAASTYQLFLVASVLTMGATPLLLFLAPRLVDLLLRLPVPARLKVGLQEPRRGPGAAAREPLHDHLVVIGFGVAGRNVARAARQSGIPYVVIEINPQTVRSERSRGEAILFGDAIHETILEAAGVDRARAVAVTVPHPESTGRIVAACRRLSTTVHIIARSRYDRDMEQLLELGANEAIPEELEVSVEIFAHVLSCYFVPHEEIARLMEQVRIDRYSQRRGAVSIPSLSRRYAGLLPDQEIATLRLASGSPAAGRSLAELALRQKHAVTVLFVRRGTETLPNPSGSAMLRAEDRITLIGPAGDVARAATYLGAVPEEPELR